MRFLEFVIIGLILFLFLGCSKKSNKQDDKKQSNVLFLIVDDMNDYGFYNTYPGVKMPYLEKFKSSAVTFENAYCASPICTPSRAATFSGLYPHETGAYFNGSDPWKKSSVLKSIETIPECFKRNGYETFGNGKLYHASLEEGRDNKNWDNKHYGGGFKPFPDKEHQLKGNFWGHQAFDDSAFPDCRNADSTIAFLQRKHDKPFFAALGLWRPHSPFTCPQRFYDMYDIDKITLPEGYRKDDLNDVAEQALKFVDPFKRFGKVSGDENPEKWKEMIWAYLACNSFADWNIGRVIEALDNSEYADNTIVVFWSDNGYHCGEKNHWEKGTLWEQACSTPMAIRLPNGKNAGKTAIQPVSLVDLFPTLVDYCGIDGPQNGLSGKSVLPILNDLNIKRNYPALTTLGEHFVSLRNEQYRFIQYGNGEQELYDHKTDPFEFKNLANNEDLTAVIEEFQKHIPTTWIENTGGRSF